MNELDDARKELLAHIIDVTTHQDGNVVGVAYDGWLPPTNGCYHVCEDLAESGFLRRIGNEEFSFTYAPTLQAIAYITTTKQ